MSVPPKICDYRKKTQYTKKNLYVLQSHTEKVNDDDDDDDDDGNTEKNPLFL